MALRNGVSRLRLVFLVQFVPRRSATSISFACPICGAPCKSQSGLNYHHMKRHSVKLSSHLRQNPVATYTKIFGTNYKSLSAKELRYSKGLVVTLEGKYRGYWYSFGSGRGGGPLKAISQTHATPQFSDTMKVALEISGLTPKQVLKLQEEDFETTSGDNQMWDETRIARVNTAKSIWTACELITGTLAEKYLAEHRKIPAFALSRLCFKFLGPNKVFREFLDRQTYETRTNGNPALVVPVEDGLGTMTGVQRIYLDPTTADKSTKSAKSKLSKGVIRNSVAVVQKAQFGQPLILCEGPETGASLAAAFPDASVFASLSLANLQGCSEVIKAQSPSQVVVAGDLDQEKANQEMLQAHFESLQDQLTDMKVRLIVPRFKEKNHGDWNDILKDHGIDEIKRQIRL